MGARPTWAAIAVVLSLSTPGCWVPPPAPAAAPIQKEVLVDAPFENVWQHAVEWFAKNDMPIKNLDKASGLIATDHEMSIDKASRFMSCGTSGPNAEGKTEQIAHRGNFNLVLREQPDGKVKASVHAFFGCTENVYKYVAILSTDMQLASSTRKDCSSTGLIEQMLLNDLRSIRVVSRSTTPAEPAPATSPGAQAVPPASATPPAASGACVGDADCRAGRVCRAGACTTPSCAKDVDCPEPQICEAGVCTTPPAAPK
jgi:hypothetical protein